MIIMHFDGKRIVYVIFVTHEMSDRKKNGLQTKQNEVKKNPQKKLN